jgi:hypothetical protein
LSSIIYRDFDLVISRSGDGYRASVRRSGVIDESVNFSKADIMVDEQIENGGAVSTRARLVSTNLDPLKYHANFGVSPRLETAKVFGTRLFTTLFKEKLYLALRLLIDRAKSENAFVRIRLDLTDVPELGSLPWEYLYDTNLNHFYATSIKTPIVRYLSVGNPVEPLIVQAPLRILVVISQPTDASPLNVEKEWEDLKNEVRKMDEAGNIELERLPDATIDALQRVLSERFQNNPFHVFHFIGHGVFDKAAGEGKLLFKNNDGKARPLSGARLGDELRDWSFRLAVINACEGARISASDSYTGTAQSLIRQAGIPAVVAMQYEITDRSAIKFTPKFYKAITDGYPIDAALTLARKAISDLTDDEQGYAEWGSPVLYLRANDGDLLQIKSADAVAVHKEAEPAIKKAPTEFEEHFKNVIRFLLDGTLVPFLGLDINLYGREFVKDWKPGQHLPGRGELTDYLAKQFDYPSDQEADLGGVSQYAAIVNKGTGELYQELKEIFSRSYEPTALHEFLANLPKLLRDYGFPKSSDLQRQRFIVVTSTYDNLLESAFGKHTPRYHVVSYITKGEQSGRFQHSQFAYNQLISQPQTIDDPANYQQLSDSSPVILKLPGAVEAYEQRFAITEDHYSDYLSCRDLSGLLPPQIKGKLKEGHHLFFGVSVRNWSLRALLYRIWERHIPNNTSWAVHPTTPLIDEQFWKAYGIEIIGSRFEDYIAEMQERLQNTLRGGG